jgi:hypothetical protein
MLKRIIAHFFNRRKDPVREASRWYWRQVALDPVYVRTRQ